MKKAASGDSSIEGLWTHHLPAAQRRPLPPHSSISASTRRRRSWIGMGFCSVWKPLGHGFCLLHRRERCVDLRCFHPYSRSFVQVFVRVLSWSDLQFAAMTEFTLSSVLICCIQHTPFAAESKGKHKWLTASELFSVKIISLFLAERWFSLIKPDSVCTVCLEIICTVHKQPSLTVQTCNRFMNSLW